MAALQSLSMSAVAQEVGIEQTKLNRMFVRTECSSEPKVRQKYAAFAEHVRPKTEQLFGQTEQSAELSKFGSVRQK